MKRVCYTHTHITKVNLFSPLSDVSGAAGGHTDGGWHQSSHQELEPINPTLRDGSHASKHSFLYLVTAIHSLRLPCCQISSPGTILFNKRKKTCLLTGASASKLAFCFAVSPTSVSAFTWHFIKAISCDVGLNISVFKHTPDRSVSDGFFSAFRPFFRPVPARSELPPS